MATLAAHGYERVKPPLVEFEETLLSGAGAAMATATFRTMDPGSQRMIGVRADMTPQIARIAATRLGNAARPLRLSYAGQVLRVKGSEIRPERQIGQVGAELIGGSGPPPMSRRSPSPARAGGARRAASVGRPHPADPGAGGGRCLWHIRRASRGAARRARPQGRRRGRRDGRRGRGAAWSAAWRRRGRQRRRSPPSIASTCRRGRGPSGRGSAPCSTGSRMPHPISR